MSEILKRSILAAPYEESAEFPAGHKGDNQPGSAVISLTGTWTGGVTLYHSLGDGEWLAVKTYANGPEEDTAIISSKAELFKFIAAANFSGTAKVIAAQGEVLA